MRNSAMKSALALTLLSFISTAAFADGDKDLVKELLTDGINVGNLSGAVDVPKSATSMDELNKLIEDEKTRNRLAKVVNFDKQKLLIFVWRGSGQDLLEVTGVKDGKEPEITFTATRGRTKDLRAHLHLFVVPKEATWKVEK